MMAPGLGGGRGPPEHKLGLRCLILVPVQLVGPEWGSEVASTPNNIKGADDARSLVFRADFEGHMGQFRCILDVPSQLCASQARCACTRCVCVKRLKWRESRRGLHGQVFAQGRLPGVGLFRPDCALVVVVVGRRKPGPPR